MDVAAKIFQNLGVSVKVTNAVQLGKRNNKPRLLKISVDSLNNPRQQFCRTVLNLEARRFLSTWLRCLLPQM